MSRISIREQVLNAIALLLIQLPLVHRVVLFDRAFAFFYLGFILLLPYRLSSSLQLIIGFLSGLLVDIFSNTPGIHASVCVLIMFIRNWWIQVVIDDTEELVNVNHISFKNIPFAIYLFPLILIHHLLIFLIENGGFYLFGSLLVKVLFSSLFTFIVIFILNLLIVPRGRRA